MEHALPEKHGTQPKRCHFTLAAAGILERREGRSGPSPTIHLAPAADSINFPTILFQTMRNIENTKLVHSREERPSRTAEGG